MHAFLPIFAQAAAAPPGGGMQMFIVQLVVIGAIWYFLWIRPQQKARRTHEAALMALHKGDEVVTAGGLVGEVIHVKESLKDGQALKTLDDRVTLRTGESKVVVERGRITKVSSAAGSETKA